MNRFIVLMSNITVDRLLSARRKRSGWENYRWPVGDQIFADIADFLVASSRVRQLHKAIALHYDHKIFQVKNICRERKSTGMDMTPNLFVVFIIRRFMIFKKTDSAF